MVVYEVRTDEDEMTLTSLIFKTFNAAFARAGFELESHADWYQKHEDETWCDYVGRFNSLTWAVGDIETHIIRRKILTEA